MLITVPPADLRRLRPYCVLAAESTQWHSLVALDSSLEPLSGLLTWADTRAAADPMPDVPDPAAWAPSGGTWVHAQYWSRKAPWLLRRLGSTPHGWLACPSTCTPPCSASPGASISSASGTGLFNWAKNVWDDEAIDRMRIARDLLPSVLPNDWTGALEPSWRERWPQLARAPWHPPLGDGAASNLGAGCIDPSAVAITVGTSAAVRVVQPADEAADVPPAGLFAWAQDVLNLPSDEKAATIGLGEIPIGATTSPCSPYLAGTRAPRDVPAGSGVIAGLSLGTNPVGVVAAAIEGMCFEISSGPETLVGLLDESGSEVVGGGGALEKSPFCGTGWRRRWVGDCA